MIIEITVRDDKSNQWDTVLLTEQMLNDLIANNPQKLQKIIQKLGSKFKAKQDPDNPKNSLSYLMLATQSVTK